MTDIALPMNRFQRWYFAWAQPHYARMPPELRADVERIDRWLYSRHGLQLWLGLLLAMAASAAGLIVAGFPWMLALACSLMLWLGLPMGALGAWLQPDRFTPRRLLGALLKVVAGGYLGALLGFLVGRIEKHGGLKIETLGPSLWSAAREATPFLLVAIVVITLLLGGVAQMRRLQMQRQIAQMRLVHERDQAARQAAEAQLKLLQGQIQPHFIFNTLSALQHWVDTGDTRAGPLLQELTRFLRGSTELLGRERATLAQEFELVRHYLAIQQARLGSRLAFEVSLPTALVDAELPPGLLLTLVENAVEHGLSPSLHGGRVELAALPVAAGVALSVRDDGVGLAPDWIEGVGLANCRERARHQFGPSASVDVTQRTDSPGTEVRVVLPQTPRPAVA